MLKHSGISLLEVLAAIFVVAIGLLGVLAVIPFGAYQVSKAQHAEFASNMLANATEEIVIRNMGKESWNSVTPNYTKFVWCEPHPIFNAPAHITRALVEDWKELMRGQDDLVYNTYDDKRPDFRKNQDDEVVIQSSGKYNWFFTYLPLEDEDEVTADVLACHNRVRSDDVQVQAPDVSFMPAFKGGKFTFSNGNNLVERLTQTKYVFVTWMDASKLNGTWCKIVFVDKSNPANPQIVVTGSLPEESKNDMHVYIPSGVLYHKRVESVPIR